MTGMFIRIMDPDFSLLLHPEVRKAPDPGSEILLFGINQDLAPYAV
jgi:hypothetical protein